VWVPDATEVWIRDVAARGGEAVAVGNAEVRASKDRIGVLLSGCHEWVKFNAIYSLSDWHKMSVRSGSQFNGE
jgi:hypothetical protein